MSRTVIVFSTPTSATGSLFRCASAIASRRYTSLQWVPQLFREGRTAEVRTSSPPAEDHIVLHNSPHMFNPGTQLGDYRFILNTRDPRDLICNQYHWQFVHPVHSESPEQTAARRERVAAAGIDHFALQQDNGPYLRGFLQVARRIAPPDRIFVGYAMYCLHFDEMVDRMARFLDVRIDDLPAHLRARIELERVENLADNQSWTGQVWPGADTAPGRHRQELQPETIRILTERYGWFLDFLRRMDDPRMAAMYG